MRPVVLAIIFLATACTEVFSPGPFSARVEDRYTDTSQKNMEKLRSADTVYRETFKVALISDSHYHYNDLADVIADINERQEFSFILVAGDFTENGLLKEFEIFHDLMQESAVPWLTAIGNHDHLSNGKAIYREMFGPLNYTFSFNKVKFVFWDNTIWESETEADYEWLSANILPAPSDENFDGTPVNHVIPVSHIPPFDGQMSQHHELFHEILKTQGIGLSIHGHKHEFFLGELYGDGVQYLTIGSPKKRSYVSLTISTDALSVEQISF